MQPQNGQATPDLSTTSLPKRTDTEDPNDVQSRVAAANSAAKRLDQVQLPIAPTPLEGVTEDGMTAWKNRPSAERRGDC